MFETLKADFDRYYELLPPPTTRWSRFCFFLSCQGMWAILDYRLRRWAAVRRGWVRRILSVPIFFFHVAVQTATGVSIPTGCRIGRGLYIGHFCGIFLHDNGVMGEHCSLSQGVTIGLGGKGEKFGAPMVGDDVYFGAGAKAFGKITIGSHTDIGANAVVLDSVPEGATAVGVPARVITKEEKQKRKQ